MKKLVSWRGRQPRAARQQGVTLLELVIAMVIVSIIAAVAVPSYTSYIQRSRRSEAKSALLNMASLEERYFSTTNTYSQTPSDLGYGGALPVTLGSGYYQVTAINVTAAVPPANAASVGTPASFTITATPFPGSTQAADTACTSFTISSTGQQTSTGTLATCWQ